MLKKRQKSNVLAREAQSQKYQAYKLFFSTLTSLPRLKIINLLREGAKNVSEIQHRLKLEQSVVSHNLRRLRYCGFIFAEKKGRYRYYSLNKKTIKPLMLLIDKHKERYCKKIIAKRKKKKKVR